MIERDRVTRIATGVSMSAAETEAVDRLAQARERIGVGGGDENVAKIQLAARWAEQYAPNGDDTLDEALRRFKRAFSYIDTVVKLLEPEEA